MVSLVTDVHRSRRATTANDQPRRRSRLDSCSGAKGYGVGKFEIDALRARWVRLGFSGGACACDGVGSEVTFSVADSSGDDDEFGARLIDVGVNQLNESSALVARVAAHEALAEPSLDRRLLRAAPFQA